MQFAPFLNRNGVRLLLGTDMTWFAVPGFSDHDELELLVRAGLSPRDALLTGTSNVADFLGETHNSGRIAVGENADLLLLNANPLADIRNSRHIAGVMIGRYWIDRSGIEQILERLRKR
ncbi:MAG TPA: amidohydrolase family protein [Thermoanaerobaculia bacterium]|nr:amidohydrolase family protein [Thermoanaerobaculia bacterium]